LFIFLLDTSMVFTQLLWIPCIIRFKIDLIDTTEFTAFADDLRLQYCMPSTQLQVADTFVAEEH